MKLYIMRHGHSFSPTEAGVATDAERPLSPKGIEEARAAGAEIKSRGAKPALVLASPLLRAQQTAEQTLRALGGGLELKTYEPLSNQITGPELYARLRKAGYEESELLLVGHQPQVGELTAHLCDRVFPFPTAGVVALDAPAAGKAKLLWHFAP